VTFGRTRTATLLALAALGALIYSAVAAYATFDFWETAPLLASVFVFGAASAGAIYVATHRRLLTVGAAVFLVVGHFVLLAAITLGRWGG
jgi:hypothetical protein